MSGINSVLYANVSLALCEVVLCRRSRFCGAVGYPEAVF